MFEDLVPVWEAFIELSETRPVGFGVGAIQFDEIEAWLRLHDVTDPNEVADTCHLLRALDKAWLRHQAERNKDGETDSTG